MRIPALFAFLIASVAAAGGAVAATGENLVTNGSFATGLSGWSRAEYVAWSPAWGGAARVNQPGSPGAEALLQCVPVTGGELYALSAAASLPERADGSGGLSVRVRWHDAPGCQGSVLRGAPTLEFAASAEVRQERERLVAAPAEARSALVSLVARADTSDVYSFAVDEVALAPEGRGAVLTIPSAASAPAANGQRFATDLWVRNAAPRDRMFSMTMRCPAPCGQHPEPIVLRLGPNETRYFADVVRDTLGGGARGRAGAVELFYDPRDGALEAFARVATANDELPGNGTAIPVLPRSARTTTATFLGLAGLGGEAGLRVNAGAYNPNDAATTVTVLVRDAAGGTVGSIERTWAPREWFQLNDVLAAAGATTGAAASVVVESGLPLFPFVIAIDNRSGDPTWLPATDATE